MIATVCTRPEVRLNRVLKTLGIARSVWYARQKAEPRKPGRKPKPVPEVVADSIRQLARSYPWWGYKRIAVVARRTGLSVSNKLVYRVMKEAKLLQKRRMGKPALYQTARLFELLPQGVNELLASGRDLPPHPGAWLVVCSDGH